MLCKYKKPQQGLVHGQEIPLTFFTYLRARNEWHYYIFSGCLALIDYLYPYNTFHFRHQLFYY
jgi:hypothetical protein